MSEPGPVFMLCRQASDPLLPGSELGYRCKVCREALQVSSEGIIQIKIRGIENVILLCHPCGMEFAKEVLEKQPDRLVNVVVHTAAQDQLRRQGISVEDLIGRPSRTPAVTESECIVCGAPHTSREGERVDCRCGAGYVVAKGAAG